MYTGDSVDSGGRKQEQMLSMFAASRQGGDVGWVDVSGSNLGSELSAGDIHPPNGYEVDTRNQIRPWSEPKTHLESSQHPPRPEVAPSPQAPRIRQELQELPRTPQVTSRAPAHQPPETCPRPPRRDIGLAVTRDASSSHATEMRRSCRTAAPAHLCRASHLGCRGRGIGWDLRGQGGPAWGLRRVSVGSGGGASRTVSGGPGSG